jgi:hypothetical protein
MSQSSNPPSHLENLDTIISALGEPNSTEEDRRLFLRAAVSQISVLTGQVQVRLDAIVTALTPKRGA